MSGNPDFLVIGAMKSGTTSLFRWLGALPQVGVPEIKEVDFFSLDHVWDRGIDWYRSLFPDGVDLTGEASPSYMYPEHSETAARRIQETLPEVKLICLLREPNARARSHYRHEVQRGRESLPLSEALTVDSPYVQRSRYFQNLAPYLDRFTEDQLLIVEFRDLTQSSNSGWAKVLDFLGLPETPLPDAVHVPSAEKPQFSRLFMLLWKSGALKQARRLPQPVREAGKRLLTSDDDSYRQLLESSKGSMDPAVEELLSEDRKLIEEALGRTLWPQSVA